MEIKKLIKRFIKKYFTDAETIKIAKLEKELNTWQKGPYPPGHFYSPIFIPENIENNLTINFLNVNTEILGINLNNEKQKKLLFDLKKYYECPNFPNKRIKNFTYWHENQYFGYSDSITLSCMMQHFKPKRIIEVGSGFSSAVMMDVNKIAFDSNLDITFIEPFPEERLYNIFAKNNDYKLIKDFVQNIPLELFKQLQVNDILFIDSSHVGKFGSDVLHLLFNILPILNKGVIIHFHDVFYPFEYPYTWLKQGRFWNESYFLRAFLMYNPNFEILFYSSYLEKKYSEWYLENMPKCLIESYTINIDGNDIPVGTQGQSIYIVKK